MDSQGEKENEDMVFRGRRGGKKKGEKNRGQGCKKGPSLLGRWGE